MQLLTVRLCETTQIYKAQERTEGGRHLQTCNLCRQRRVDGLNLQQNRNRALCILRQQRLRGRLTVDEAEVSAVARILTARTAIADGRRLKILRRTVVEERS